MRRMTFGFTLVEIMVVIFIVSLLVSVAIVEGVRLRKLANESNCQANLKAIAAGFEVYAVIHGGAYASGSETNLQFLVDAHCLYQDFVSLGPVNNFHYTVALAGPGGYDIRAMATNSALSDHNYQIITGGILRRSDTSSPGDENFKTFR